MQEILKHSAIVLILWLLPIVTLSTTSKPKYDGYFSQENLSSKSLKPLLSKEYSSNNGRKVYVFDGAVSYAMLMAARVYFSFNDDWRYVLFDKYVVDPEGRFDQDNGVPWKSWQNPTVLSGTRLGQTLKALIQTVQENLTTDEETQSLDFQLTEVYSAILRRGDVTNLHRGADNFTTNSTPESYSALMYTNTVWRKNSYGEILFFEDDDDFDVFSVVSPRCGRIVLWDNRIRYLLRPPSITELSGQYMIFAQFETDPTVIFERRNHFETYLSKLQESKESSFVCSTNVEKVPKLDMEKHVTLKRYNKAGEFVTVFDGLFNKSDLDTLRTYTVKYGKYFYDDNLDLTSDNVQWIAGFEVEKFVKSRFWPIIRQVAAYVSGKDTWYPYDIACNLIRRMDHTRFHLDTSRDDEEEMTFLLYLSPNWTAANYGETAFMELNYDSPENDYVAEVVPLYGRAVIFGGNFPHSAHPPAPDYDGPRYTFAVKLSASKWEAVSKTFSEESRHSTDFVNEFMRNINSDPNVAAATHKVAIVSSFLQTKQVQAVIDRNPKTPENLQQATSKRGFSEEEDESSSLIQSLLGDESEVPLSKENQQLVMGMIKHYGLDGLQFPNEDEKPTSDPEADANMTFDPEADANMTFDPEADEVSSREEAIRSWKRRCGADADCLADYLDLFLRQEEELKRRAQRDLLSLI